MDERSKALGNRQLNAAPSYILITAVLEAAKGKVCAGKTCAMTYSLPEMLPGSRRETEA